MTYKHITGKRRLGKLIVQVPFRFRIHVRRDLDAHLEPILREHEDALIAEALDEGCVPADTVSQHKFLCTGPGESST